MFVIPMAGLSSRFTDAGYNVPKYMLPLDGRTVFDTAVASFERYFESRPFLFIARETGGAAEFISARAVALNIADFRLVILDQETAGQAETVECGLVEAGVTDDVPLTIFNIDTFRPGFAEPSPVRENALAGWLEVFEGEGANWSYVRPAIEGERIAAETAEKRPISNLCCTGLYHFARADAFSWALDRERHAPQAKELYVAPIYNHLIQRGDRIGYECIPESDVIFCGTPGEYEALLTG